MGFCRGSVVLILFTAIFCLLVVHVVSSGVSSTPNAALSPSQQAPSPASTIVQPRQPRKIPTEGRDDEEEEYYKSTWYLVSTFIHGLMLMMAILGFVLITMHCTAVWICLLSL